MQTIEKINDRFWYQTPVSETDRPILGVVVGDDKTLMIDAGNSEAHAEYFLNELKEKGVPMPDFVVLTHWHWDHIFGLSALDIPSISSAETKIKMKKLVPFSWSDEALDERVEAGIEIEFCASAIKKEFGDRRDVRITLPTLTFDDQIEIDLGGVTCILKKVGGDHASDSVVVYVKEEKILFLADCIYVNLYAEKRHYITEEITRLLDELEKFDADYYVLSHWKPITKKEFEAEVKLLRDTASLTEKLHGNTDAIKTAFEKKAGRPLNENELETIQYFVNGYELKNK